MLLFRNSNCKMSHVSHPYKMWLSSVSEFLSKQFFPFLFFPSKYAVNLLSLPHNTQKFQHTYRLTPGWEQERTESSDSLSWRNMVSEWRVRSNLWMGLQPVVVCRSFHPFPQHGGTSIHKVDVVREQHGCSTSHRSHGQDTRHAELCAIVTLYKTRTVVHSCTYFSRNNCCEKLFISRENCYFC